MTVFQIILIALFGIGGVVFMSCSIPALVIVHKEHSTKWTGFIFFASGLVNLALIAMGIIFLLQIASSSRINKPTYVPVQEQLYRQVNS